MSEKGCHNGSCRGSHLISCHEKLPRCKPAQALRAGASAASLALRATQRCEPVDITSKLLCKCKATAEKRPVDRNRSSKWCCRNSPAGRPAARPLGGGERRTGPPSMVVPAPKVAVGCRERAGVPVSPAAGPARRESQPPAVCATSTEAEARAGCIYPQGLWPGRCPLSRSPGPRAAPTQAQARRGGALERRNPLKYFHIRPKATPCTPPTHKS